MHLQQLPDRLQQVVGPDIAKATVSDTLANSLCSLGSGLTKTASAAVCHAMPAPDYAPLLELASAVWEHE